MLINQPPFLPPPTKKGGGVQNRDFKRFLQNFSLLFVKMSFETPLLNFYLVARLFVVGSRRRRRRVFRSPDPHSILGRGHSLNPAENGIAREKRTDGRKYTAKLLSLLLHERVNRKLFGCATLGYLFRDFYYILPLSSRQRVPSPRNICYRGFLTPFR